MDSLVERLCRNRHDVVASRAKSSAELKEDIDSGLVFVKFTGTKGGTELGVKVTADQITGEGLDFVNGQGTLRLVGELTLDYEKVQLIANIDLATLTGQGQLVRV